MTRENTNYTTDASQIRCKSCGDLNATESNPYTGSPMCKKCFNLPDESEEELKN